ncbi:tyrosine-type recombinase/integrase [Thermodesulfobacteriota bacterium]
MRVISAAHTDSDKSLIESFQVGLMEQDLSSATIKAYLHDLKIFREWLLRINEGRSVPFAQVGTIDLAAFRKHLVREKSLRPSTVNRRVQSLRLFFGWLRDKGYAADNPAESLRFMRRSTRERPLSLKRNEVMSLLRAVEASQQGMGRRNTALIQVMLQTGLRVGEVAALRHEDLKIRKRSGSVRVREGKGRKEREVPLNTTARKSLTNYIGGLEARLPSDAVFHGKRGNPLSVRGIQKVVSALARRAEITRIPVSAHTLRHTFAVNYLKSNQGKLVELSSLMGHESLNTTAIYTRPSREDLSEDLERSPLNVLGE